MDKHSIQKMLRLPFKEEVSNTISHGVLAVVMLLLLPFASIYGYQNGGWLLGIGNGIFVISIFLMLLTSTLFHSMAYDTKHKTVFRILDHSMIYVAIAGSYTPIALYAIGGKLGIFIALFQWVLVVLGISYKVLSKKANPKLGVSVYLLMGWTALFLLPELVRNAGWLFVSLIALGGILYSIGTFFYMRQHKPFYHFIWHLFIDAAVITHFVAIIFLMP